MNNEIPYGCFGCAKLPDSNDTNSFYDCPHDCVWCERCRKEKCQIPDTCPHGNPR